MRATVTVAGLYAALRHKLALTWLAGEGGGGRRIEPVPEGTSGLCPVGHLNLIHLNHVQVLGAAELSFIEGLGHNSRHDTIGQIFAGRPAAVIVAGGQVAAPDLLEIAARTDTPLLATPLVSQDLINRLQFYLSQALAERITMHGVFMEVLGIGVMITGSCGVGKSELALELISRGHRLVADDITEFTRPNPDTLSGSCPELLQDFLEVRGLGVLNIRAMFGDSAIRAGNTLSLVVALRPMNDTEIGNLDRLRGSHDRRRILDVEIPEVTLPVAPGRNLAVLVETAVRNHILKLAGYDAAGDFIGRQQARIAAAAEGDEE